MKTATPPKLFLKFFRWYCHPKLKDSIEGDLMELYREREVAMGKRQASFKFIIDVLLLFRPGIIRSFNPKTTLNQSDMFANYFKIAFRILIRNKGYSFINISGLAVGLASAMLILLWVENEVSYDRFHSKADRIYKMFSRDNFNGATNVWPTTPSLMGQELKQTFGEVEEATRFRVVYFLVKAGEERFNEQGAFADPSYLSLFDFQMHDGKRTALANDFGIVLSEPMAIKLFGKTDCVGKPVIVNEKDNFTVTAVLKELPTNTEFQFQFLLPWNYMTRLGWDQFQDWTQTNALTYVLLKPSASFDRFQSKVMTIVQSHVQKGDGTTREIIAHPMRKVHLYSQAENGQLTNGRIETVRLFSAIAVLIVLIACINFMNLSTARSEKRTKEVGVRKVVGAQKRSLITQFISESTLLVMISFAVAIGLVQLSIGAFNLIVEVPLRINFINPQYWLFALFLILSTGLLAGSYPAFYLSSAKPLKVLKGAFRKVNAIVTPRKVLVVTQFTFAIVLSICAIMVQRQIQYGMSRDAGYNRSAVAYNFMQGEVPQHYDAIRNELLSSGAAVAVTRTFSPVTRIWNVENGYSWQGSGESDKTTSFLQFGSDRDLVKTLGVTILQGRDIDIYTYASDTAAVLLNETAVEMMRLKDPIGEVIKNDNGQTFQVIGVVKNFIVGSPYQEVGPMIVKGWTERYGAVHFRLDLSHGQTEALQKAELVFKKFNPEYPFEYYFADDFYNQKFGNERRTATLATLFAGLTIFISCLGLFGLAAYMAENRTKEIGIRKVMGASSANIAALVSRDFIQLVIFSIVIASPLAFFAVRSWLQSFKYHVPIGSTVFVVTAVVAIMIAILTVSFQSIKAGMANPVDSLRNE